MGDADRIIGRIRTEGTAKLPVRSWRLVWHLAVWAFGVVMWPIAIAAVVAIMRDGDHGPLAVAGLCLAIALLAALGVGTIVVAIRSLSRTLGTGGVRLGRDGLIVIRRDGTPGWARPIPWQEVEAVRSITEPRSRTPGWPRRTELILTREGAVRRLAEGPGGVLVAADSAIVDVVRRVLLPWGLAGGPGSASRVIQGVAQASRAGALGPGRPPQPPPRR